MASKREKIIAWVAGAAIGAYVLNSLVIDPLLAAKTSAESRLKVANQALQEFNNTTFLLRKSRAKWASLGGESLTTDASAAEIQLGNRVNSWSEQSGLQVASLKVESPTRESSYRKTTVRVTANGSMGQIARFLYLAQKGDIPVRITDLQINTRKEATDDLALQVSFATIFLPDAEKKPTEATP